jgi:hypothetical protein
MLLLTSQGTDLYRCMVQINWCCLYITMCYRGERGTASSDKLAVGHEPAPETQLPTDAVSLHVSYRTAINGTVPPAK